MPSPRNSTANLDRKPLALAAMQAVRMWGNLRYQMFLNRTEPGELTDEWFGWFVGSWKVARCIKDGRRTRVREYLDRDFRHAVSEGADGSCVDTAAQHLRRQGWSSRECLPLSLVSKVAFFLRPDRFVPLDRFSVRGLTVLRAHTDACKLKHNSYRTYLEAFDQQYARLEPQLKAALDQHWVIEMADQLGCPRAALGSLAMRRKLFDDYLMHSAEYESGA